MFGDYAQKYFEKGFSVIPVFGKNQPAIKMWQKFCSELPTQDDIDEWCTKFPRANIALCCGEISNVTVLDADTEKVVDLFKQHNIISPIGKIGKKGITYFFKWNRDTKKNYSGLDIISSGGYTIIPPSIHPETTKPYVWTAESILESEDLPDYPTDKVSLLLSKITGVIKKGEEGRNSILFSMCQAAIDKDKNAFEIAKELFDHDLRVHKNHPEGPWFLDKTQPHKGLGELAAVEFVVKRMRYNIEKNRSVNRSILQADSQTKEVEENFNEPVPEFKFPKPKSKVLDEVISFIMSTSRVKRYDFSLAAALCVCGIVIGQKYKFKGEYSNLYILLLLASGGGKDGPLKGAERVLDRIDMGDLFGLRDYVSDAGFLKPLEENSVRLDRIDEIHTLFHSIESKDKNLHKISKLLNEIFTSQNDVFKGAPIKNETYGYCAKPCLSVIGATTIESFSSNFTKKILDDGLGGRFLYITDFTEMPYDYEHQEFFLSEYASTWFKHYGKSLKINYEQRKVSGIKRIVYNEKTKKDEIINLETIKSPIDLFVYATEEANKMLENFIKVEIPLLKNVYDKRMGPIFNRAVTYLNKISLIHSATRAPFDSNSYSPSFRVDEMDAQFAIDFVKAHLYCAHKVISENLSEGSYDSKYRSLFKIVSSKGPITIREIAKHTNKYSSDDIKKYCGSMVTLGKFIQEQDGRKTTFRIN